MPKTGFGADKSTFDNIDWDGFGIGSNVVTLDIKDGKILRTRPLDYSETYDLEDLNRFELEVDGKVFREPSKSPIPPFSFAYKRHAFSRNRIPYPLIRESFDPNGDRHTELRGVDKYKRISWDEATEIIAREVHRQFEVYGPGSILVQQDGHGETKIVHPCHGCMTKLIDMLGGAVVQARQPDSWEGWYWGAKHTWGMEPLGQGKTQNLFYDITMNTKMILYWGCDNETTTWGWCGQIPSMLSFWWSSLGIESVFICPDVNYSAAVHADKWIPVYPNTDLALQMAIAYVWMTEGIYDREYIDTHTIGFDWLEYEVLQGGDEGVPKTPEWAAERCGVPSRTIKALARRWAEVPTTTAHCNGGSFIRSCYSHEPGRMEVCLLAMQGLGKPGRNFMKFIEWNIYEVPDFNPMPRDEEWLTGFAGYNASMLEAEASRFIPKTLIPEGILATKDKPIDWYGHVICMMPADDQTKHFQFPEPGDPTLHMIWSDAPCWATCWNCGNKYLEALRSPNLEFVLVQHPWFENDTHFADIVLPVSTRYEVNDIGYDNY
ncbi:MAG: molybdopterin-dependent oxidoreductase, partial [Coriobacteriales bacterium]